MNLRQMEVFRAIMETGSVTGAARLLNVSQPAVTALLRHTEDQLRFQLFQRVKGRLEPTQEAQALRAEVEQVFDRVEVVQRVIVGLQESRLGALNIVAITAIGNTLLPAAIGRFCQQRPEARIRFQMRSRQEVVERIASGAADLGFGFLTPAFHGVERLEIARAGLMVILPPGHKLAARRTVSPADLAPYPLITYTSSQGLAPIVNGVFAEARIALRPAVEVGLVINAWALVSQGAGIAIVDPHSGLGDLFPNVVARPLWPRIEIGLEVLYPEGRPPSRLAARFLDHLRSILPGDHVCAAHEQPPQ
jgi:DNA-binding transcriptional LysR family regulator